MRCSFAILDESVLSLHLVIAVCSFTPLWWICFPVLKPGIHSDRDFCSSVALRILGQSGCQESGVVMWLVPLLFGPTVDSSGTFLMSPVQVKFSRATIGIPRAFLMSPAQPLFGMLHSVLSLFLIKETDLSCLIHRRGIRTQTCPWKPKSGKHIWSL